MNENCIIDEIFIMKKKIGNNISKLCVFFVMIVNFIVSINY